MTRATRRQIQEAIVALDEIQLNRITLQNIECRGCGAKDEEDCQPGCWAAVVEECTDRMAALLMEPK